MSRFLLPVYQTMEVYTPGEQPRDRTYLKLNTNEFPFPPAPAVVQAVAAEADALALYPDPTCKALRQSLAERHGIEWEQVFVANGSDDILNFAFWAYGGAKTAKFPDITYGFYTVFAQLHQVPCEQIPLQEDFTVNWRDYLTGEGMVVLANPNAPTGLALAQGEIEAILSANRQRVVVVDEAYVDFGGESVLPLLRQYDNLLIVRTFSKSWALAGGRLGYALGSRELIADLEKLKYATNPYAINRMTMAAGLAALEEDTYYADCCHEIAEIREDTACSLRRLGFFVLPSLTNFLFVRHPQIDGGLLYRMLKEKGILVRHFDSLRIRDFNRITIGTGEQMEQLVTAITDCLQEVAST